MTRVLLWLWLWLVFKELSSLPELPLWFPLQKLTELSVVCFFGSKGSTTICSVPCKLMDYCLWISQWYSVSINLNLCPAEGTAPTPALRVLPGCETGSAEEMTTWLYPDVFRVLRADLAQLEGWAHLTVELVLLLCDPHVVLRCGLHCPREVRVDAPAVRVEITETRWWWCWWTDKRHGRAILQSFSGAV